MLAKPHSDPVAVLKQGRELSPIRQLYANLYAKLYVGARFRALLNFERTGRRYRPNGRFQENGFASSNGRRLCLKVRNLPKS